MKIFLVFQKEGESYDSLPKDAEIVTLFRYIKGNPNIAHIKRRCQEVLDTADPVNDYIVFNGPSYLCAIAGYFWMTQEGRERMNFYSFNKQTLKYCKHDDLVAVDMSVSIDPDKETICRQS